NSSFSPDEWFPSIALDGATPGFVNSVTPATDDLSLDSVAATPETGSSETEFTISCWFSNVGLNDIPSASLIMYDEDEGSEQLLAKETLRPINAGTIDTMDIKIGPLKSGFHRIVTALKWETDVNPLNDSLFITLKVSFEEGALLLSEFMAIPLDIETGNNSISEYVEVYNPGLDDMPLKGWSLCDENIGKPAQNMEKKTVSAQGYFVFAADSTIFNFTGVYPENTCVINSFPSLNNVEDCVVLKDPTGKTIDSLRYNSDWLITNNTSMERVFYTNPNFQNNWRLSASPDGGTPGRVNSVAISKEWKKPGIKVEPNPFSPNGDGFDDEVAILFKLPFPSAMVTVEIYDLMGRLIFQPAKNLSLSSEGAIYWDGSSKHGDKARIGMYVVRCSATDTMSDKTVGYVTTLVLAR
ncbi:MAG: lamin tail domain-containing protein, partial [Candidatus Marinimicrobia bacterium]|nr:lamin tail domain-containing protein [Candidatus Neomarinimicrobiota bacterium]